MLISIAYILMLGMFLSWFCKKLHLPGLMGMIFTGILAGATIDLEYAVSAGGAAVGLIFD